MLNTASNSHAQIIRKIPQLSMKIFLPDSFAEQMILFRYINITSFPKPHEIEDLLKFSMNSLIGLVLTILHRIQLHTAYFNMFQSQQLRRLYLD
jgi:hypothetical protein